MSKVVDIDGLEKQYGKLITLQVGPDTILLKKPSRAVVGMSINKGLSDPLAQAEVLIENCYVGGTLDKEDVLADIGLLVGINAQVTKIVGYKAVEVKKLIQRVDGSPNGNWIEYLNTMLQYYLHIADPDALTDELFALKINQLQHIRKIEAGNE